MLATTLTLQPPSTLATRLASARPEMGPASDAALVAGAKAGRPDDFRLLIERYESQVFGLLARMGFDQATAEDLAQEAFIRAYRALPRFRGESAFNTWLYRIVYREALQHLRAQTRRTRLGTELIRAHETAQLPDSAHGQTELRQTLDRALRELPEAQRMALGLYYFHEQSYQEVADTMEVPLNTVKTHIRRGKLRMRELLEGVVSP